MNSKNDDSIYILSAKQYLKLVQIRRLKDKLFGREFVIDYINKTYKLRNKVTKLSII